MNNKMNKMKLVLGDWSNDGHGRTKKVVIESNVDVYSIQEAYKASCKLTGVSFNHGNDFTDLPPEPYEIRNSNSRIICCENEDQRLSEYAFNRLVSHGMSDELMKSFGATKFRTYDLSENAYIRLWIWFVKLSLPSVAILEYVNDEVPVINGYWNKNLNVQFGYGLYQ